MTPIMLTRKNAQAMRNLCSAELDARSKPTLASRSTELLLILFEHRQHESRIHLRIFYPCPL